MIHKHHIIPIHMGGTNDPSNIVELTVEEHAEAHKKLYEKHNKIQDFWAWQGLKGYMSKQEIIHAKCSASTKKKNKIMWADPKFREMMSRTSKWSVAGIASLKNGKGKKNGHAKKYYVTKDGKNITINCLKTWCEKRNLNYNTFHRGLIRTQTEEYNPNVNHRIDSYKGYKIQKIEMINSKKDLC